jgi:hypothetical protein
VHSTQKIQAFKVILIVILPLAYISANVKSPSGIVTFTSIFYAEENISTKSSTSSVFENISSAKPLI